MFKCQFCGHEGIISDFEIDHSIPRSRLNGYIPNNLKWVCSGCNRQKSNKTDYEYILWRALNPFYANFGPIKK